MLKKIIRYITNSNYRFIYNAAHGMYNNMPDEEYLRRMFKAKLGEDLDLDNPQTYNEKIQWLKLYDRKSIYATMVDKYEVKNYVASKIGKEYIIPNLGVWDNVEDIAFEKLPNQFVLKCTHDSHGIVICKDKEKLDIAATKKKLRRALKQNYYLKFREWPYKNVKPRIIAEAYLTDESKKELRDYKVLCFGGEPKLIELHSGRFTDHATQDIYDTQWNKTKITQAGHAQYKATDVVAPQPETLDEMINLSKELSKDIPHVRVDWYSVYGKLYFGEITFYDGSGLYAWDRREDDLMLGSWINLPSL